MKQATPTPITDNPQLATAAGQGDWNEPRQKVVKAQMAIMVTVFATFWSRASASGGFFSPVVVFASLII
jgi:hypothetical protein